VPARARIALIGASVGALLLLLVWAVALHTGFGQHADQSIFTGFAGLQRPRVNGLASTIAKLCDPKPFVVFAVAIVAVALVRRRPRIALAAAGILLGANATTELLKPLLATPRVHSLLPAASFVNPNSWPSGHATAAMSLALSAVLVSPARARPWVASLGAVFAVAVSYSFLTLGWHFPSDVAGGFLVATVWALLIVGALLALDARRGRLPSTEEGRPLPVRVALAPPALALLGAAALAGVLALARPHQVIVYARAHEGFIVGASTIAVLALVLATVVMLGVRR
jgi:membrane-associated phospholipid phosphatase